MRKSRLSRIVLMCGVFYFAANIHVLRSETQSRAQEGHATTEKLNLEMYGLGVGLADRKAPTFWTATSFSKFSETLKRKTIAYKDNKVYVSFFQNKITSGSSLNEMVKIEFCRSL